MGTHFSLLGRLNQTLIPAGVKTEALCQFLHYNFVGYDELSHTSFLRTQYAFLIDTSAEMADAIQIGVEKSIRVESFCFLLFELIACKTTNSTRFCFQVHKKSLS